MDVVGEFTRATRAEPGCLWFDWSRSLDDPNEYVLVEAFRRRRRRGARAVGAFQAGLGHAAGAPGGDTRIVNMTVPQDDWSLLGEMAVSES